MKNPFTPNLMRHIEALLRGSGYDEETIEYATHAINQHDDLVAERDEWRNMVAVLCGDGGHYHVEHGTAATRAYIEKRMFDLRDQHEKLVAGLELAMMWLDEVCNPDNGELSTPEGLAVHGLLAALLAEDNTTDS